VKFKDAELRSETCKLLFSFDIYLYPALLSQIFRIAMAIAEFILEDHGQRILLNYSNFTVRKSLEL
jgi:hypothetical protein